MKQILNPRKIHHWKIIEVSEIWLWILDMTDTAVEVRENGLQSEWEDITNDNIKETDHV